MGDIYVLFQQGPFDVRVKSITAVKNAQSFPSPVIMLENKYDVKELIESAIQSGGSLYDKGYTELCVAIYRSTLNSLIASKGDIESFDTLRGMACEGLNKAATKSDKREIAWILRYTFNGLLEELGFLVGDNREHWRPNPLNALTLAQQCDAVTSFPPLNVQQQDGMKQESMEKEQKDVNANDYMLGGTKVDAKEQNDNTALLITLIIMVSAVLLVIIGFGIRKGLNRKNGGSTDMKKQAETDNDSQTGSDLL